MPSTTIQAFDEGRVQTAAAIGTAALQCSSRNWPVNLLASGYVVAVHAQVRRLITNTPDTLTVSATWTTAIAAGESYAIIPLAPSGDEAVGGLAYYGVVTAVPGADQFTIPTLAGLGAGKFQ
ncbi:MAG: hypothetical protein Q8O40_07950, partial [Chloroflexota bacterium]|nr:hypothetical protein [Chloroflexota bacterium]